MKTSNYGDFVSSFNALLKKVPDEELVDFCRLFGELKFVPPTGNEVLMSMFRSVKTEIQDRMDDRCDHLFHRRKEDIIC